MTRNLAASSGPLVNLSGFSEICTQQEKPRTMPGLKFAGVDQIRSDQVRSGQVRSVPRGYRGSTPAAEAIVDAGHDKVGIAVNAVGGKEHAAGCREGRGAVIEEQVVVLNPDRPIRSKAKFETDTNRGTPTGVGVTRRNNCATKEDVIAVVDNRGAALYVEQSVVPSVSYLAGEQAECVHLGPINESGEQEAHIVAAKIGPVTLCFEAEHPTAAGLPAVADLTTDDAATRIVAALRANKYTGYINCVEASALLAPTTVRTDIKAAPVVNRSYHRGWRLGVGTCSQISRRRGSGHAQCY